MNISLVCDLRGKFGSIRDQQLRPTCMAFAITDTHGSICAPFDILSVEYLFYHAVQLMPARDPRSGVSPHAGGEALRIHGQPQEKVWPYQTVPPADLASWQPPANCPVAKQTLLAHDLSFDEICSSLNSGKPVILCLELSESFYVPLPNGVVEQRAADPKTGDHAVIAVGHGHIATERCLLIRNSWGDAWGIGGHAFLEEGYLRGRLFDVCILK
jgi:hypothetical protein